MYNVTMLLIGNIERSKMKYNSTSLGELVKLTRKGLGLTQESLALAAGTGLRFIIELEKGKPTCQLQKALTVLNVLGIQMNFVSPVDTPDPQPEKARDEA